MKSFLAATFLLLGASALFAQRRYSFSFPSFAKSGSVTEWRAVSASEGQTEASAFMEELLLGPQTYRARPLFTLGTTLEFCQLNGGVLYLGLSKRALLCGGNAADISDGFSFLKDNIRENFGSAIQDVVIFIDGRECYAWQGYN